MKTKVGHLYKQLATTNRQPHSQTYATSDHRMMQNWNLSPLEEIKAYKAAGATIRKRLRPREVFHLLIWQHEFGRGVVRPNGPVLDIMTSGDISGETTTPETQRIDQKSPKYCESWDPDTIVKKVIVMDCCDLETEGVPCGDIARMEFPSVISNYTIATKESDNPDTHTITFELVYTLSGKKEDLAPISRKQMRELLQLYVAQNKVWREDKRFLEVRQNYKDDIVLSNATEGLAVAKLEELNENRVVGIE
ncbi:hypothetical protein TWF281_002149 [Arthrobotrys megalospora]